MSPPRPAATTTNPHASEESVLLALLLFRPQPEENEEELDDGSDLTEGEDDIDDDELPIPESERDGSLFSSWGGDVFSGESFFGRGGQLLLPLGKLSSSPEIDCSQSDCSMRCASTLPDEDGKDGGGQLLPQLGQGMATDTSLQ